MRKFIEGDTIEEPVRRFLMGLDVSNEASVVEIEGRKVYILVRPQAPKAGGRLRMDRREDPSKV